MIFLRTIKLLMLFAIAGLARAEFSDFVKVNPDDYIGLDYTNAVKYSVHGKTYKLLTPEQSKDFTQRGQATWYSYKKVRYTSSGRKHNPDELTGAHKTLPFGAVVEVKDLNSGNVVNVTITDRGPFAPGKIIDLTPTAFERLAPKSLGVLDVEISVIHIPDES